MKTRSVSLASAILVALVLDTAALGQKGRGEPTGVARETSQPAVVTLSGRVLAVETGPCQMSSGRAYVGTHFLLKTTKGRELNIHLGPATVVRPIADQLKVDQPIIVYGFRTEKMPKDHYAAQSLVLGKKSIELRDQTLRPFWAGGGAAWRGRGLGGGPARGWGRGLGYGPRWGRNRGYGQGGGYGPSYGNRQTAR